jgi:hypothetical protein
MEVFSSAEITNSAECMGPLPPIACRTDPGRVRPWPRSLDPGVGSSSGKSRPDGVFGEPPPHRGIGDGGNDPSAHHLGANVGDVQPGESQPELGQQLAGQGLDLNDHLGGEDTRPSPARPLLQPPPLSGTRPAQDPDQCSDSRRFRWSFVGVTKGGRGSRRRGFCKCAGQRAASSSGRRDSNPRPPPWQGGALPLSHVRVDLRV